MKSKIVSIRQEEPDGRRRQKGRKNEVRHMAEERSASDPTTFFTACGHRRTIHHRSYTILWNEVTCPQCLKRRNCVSGF